MPDCTTCGHDISPNDVSVIERGILWVDGRPHHHLCFENDQRRLKARIAELEAERVGLVSGLIDWCEANVANYGERSCIQRHLRLGVSALVVLALVVGMAMGVYFGRS